MDTGYDPTPLREHLIAELTEAGVLRSPIVTRAFGMVDRAQFVPEVDPEQAYSTGIVTVRRDGAGRGVSSMSSPIVHAAMLEVAEPAPGVRVLEVGSGGCNAALLAACVGDSGSVTTTDVDPEIIARVERLFPFAQFPTVRAELWDAWESVGRTDGEFDLIVVTVECPTLPDSLLTSLAVGGRIVAPVTIHGVRKCIVLDRLADGLRGRVEFDCGFVAARGHGAAGYDTRAVRETGEHTQVLRETGVPAPSEKELLSSGTILSADDSGISLAVDRSPSDLWLWMFSEIAPMASWASLGLRRLGGFTGLSPLGTPVLSDRDGFAFLGWPGPVREQVDRIDVPVRGGAATGPDLARRLAEAAASWLEAGEPGRPECLLVPRDEPSPIDGPTTFRSSLGATADLVIKRAEG
ncbi:class I SAM-dependent methyltransferase [Parenemella sanctibonifatiensis]|uniref:Protein-L-isoaspartate O-methyltransferase n=1 Tax=Parenemella sanctibonifatiensis TaxID=2016505 RepID=A0A255EB29_9ACTN|nr:hypothetical protein [Parenemella sanctibonifatiensis]OYN88777.1 hypothetical protein CGZ92_03460 [Parenemella sanctibonifatiensis]